MQSMVFAATATDFWNGSACGSRRTITTEESIDEIDTHESV